ncbi:MAG: hypothetical protein ABIO46_08740 [Chitinophagales bacterium]
MTEISIVGGYTLGETFFTSDGFEVYIQDGATYGASLAYYPNEFYDISLNYTRQETKVDFYDYYFGCYTTNIPASVNNITVGFNRNQPLNDMGTALFGGLNLGTAGLEPKEGSYSGRWKFDVDFHIGAKIFPSSKVGIKLQTGLNLPIQYFGAAFTVGTGGSGAGVSANSTITQLYFLGGLIFRLQQ